MLVSEALLLSEISRRPRYYVLVQQKTIFQAYVLGARGIPAAKDVNSYAEGSKIVLIIAHSSTGIREGGPVYGVEKYIRGVSKGGGELEALFTDEISGYG